MQDASALSLVNVSKTYPNGLQAVKNLNLNVEKGEFLALLGPNGAGKTTTIGMIDALVNITDGKIEIYGYDIHKNPIQAKSLLGLVPQEINLNQFETVLNTLLYQAGFYGISRKKAVIISEKLLKQASLWDKRHQIVRTLSGGMKRRLMIARSLVHSPKVLLLDEPTAGVDIEIRQSMWQHLRKLNEEGLTVILTTHYLEEAQQLCNRLAIINHGELKLIKKVSELKQDLERTSYEFSLKQPIHALPNNSDLKCKLLSDYLLRVIAPSTYSLPDILTELKRHDIEIIHVTSIQNDIEETLMHIIQKSKTREDT